MLSALLVSGCALIATRGMNEFHSGHVDVSIKASQTCVMGALMCVEPATWTTALDAGMVGVGRDERSRFDSEVDILRCVGNADV